MTVPPFADRLLFDLSVRGWRVVIAHPERYNGVTVEAAEAWRGSGAYLQVNAGSLLGKYGEVPQRIAWGLVRAGGVDYVASDHHARGKLHGAACWQALQTAAGAEVADLLMKVNPGRMLQGEAPLPLPALPDARRPWWRRVLGG
jgi:protein-tyrosine phosphatase